MQPHTAYKYVYLATNFQEDKDSIKSCFGFLFDLMSGHRRVAKESTAREADLPKPICSICQRSRSSWHPVGHVCSRCIRKEHTSVTQPLAITVYEIHHYHHTCGCAHAPCSTKTENVIERPAGPVTPPSIGLPAGSVTHPVIELPGEDLRRPYLTTPFSSRLEDRPPLVRT
jgi:hypothetical protein